MKPEVERSMKICYELGRAFTEWSDPRNAPSAAALPKGERALQTATIINRGMLVMELIAAAGDKPDWAKSWLTEWRRRGIAAISQFGNGKTILDTDGGAAYFARLRDLFDAMVEKVDDEPRQE